MKRLFVILSQKNSMRKLVVTSLMAFVILLGSLGESESADTQKGYATALRELNSLAKQGNANAQYNLGVMHHNGRGVSQNYETAVKWYTLAAEQGNAKAQLNLGVMYENGKGVRQNYETAVKWFRLRAVAGRADAQRRVRELQKNIKS